MYVVSAFRRTSREVRLKPDTTYYKEPKTATCFCLSIRTGPLLSRRPKAAHRCASYHRVMTHALNGRLDGVRIAITGGTSGLGLALVDELTRRGARVAFVARTRARVDEVARAHPLAYGIVGDVASK